MQIVTDTLVSEQVIPAESQGWFFGFSTFGQYS